MLKKRSAKVKNSKLKPNIRVPRITNCTCVSSQQVTPRNAAIVRPTSALGCSKQMKGDVPKDVIERKRNIGMPPAFSSILFAFSQHSFSIFSSLFSIFSICSAFVQHFLSIFSAFSQHVQHFSRILQKYQKNPCFT